MGLNPLSKDGEDVTCDDLEGIANEIEEIRDEHSYIIDRMFPCRPTLSLAVEKVL
jgi:hypothetical protein